MPNNKSKILIAVLLSNGGSLSLIAETIYLRTGATIECKSAYVEGDSLNVELQHGRVSIRKDSLGALSLTKFFSSTGKPMQKAMEPAASMRETLKALKPPDPRSALHLPRYITPIAEPLISERFSVKKVEFKIQGLQIQAYIPMGKDGVPAKEASDVVFYAPYLAAGIDLFSVTKPEGKASYEGVNGMLKHLAETSGMSIYTILFPSDGVDANNEQTCWYYPASGSYEVVSEAYNKLIHDYNLTRKPMFLFSLSGGGSLIQRYAFLRPLEVAAVAIVGGGRYELLQQSADFPLLLLNTHGDVRSTESLALVKQARELKMNALFDETELRAKAEEFSERYDPNFHHVENRLALALCEEFIISIRNLRNQGSPNWPDPRKVDI